MLEVLLLKCKHLLVGHRVAVIPLLVPAGAKVQVGLGGKFQETKQLKKYKIYGESLSYPDSVHTKGLMATFVVSHTRRLHHIWRVLG